MPVFISEVHTLPILTACVYFRGPYGRDEADTENMNPEDIYNSIKKTSADIQNLSFNSKLDHYDDMKKRKDFTSQDSGVQDLRNDSPDPGELKKPHYNPSHYQDEVSTGYILGTAVVCSISNSRSLECIRSLVQFQVKDGVISKTL